jgi:hypothetical protein
MAFQERDVPKVGLPCEVEDVSDDWYGAEDGVESHICGDPEQRRARRTQPNRFYEDPTRKNGASSIAGAGD